MPYDSSRFSLTSDYPGAGALSGFSLTGPAVTQPQGNYSAGGRYSTLSLPAEKKKGGGMGNLLGGLGSLLGGVGGGLLGGGEQTPEQQMFQLIHQGNMVPVDIPPDDILRAILAQLMEQR